MRPAPLTLGEEGLVNPLGRGGGGRQECVCLAEVGNAWQGARDFPFKSPGARLYNRWPSLDFGQGTLQPAEDLWLVD